MKNLLGLNEDYQLDLKSSKKLSEEHVLEIDTKSEEDLELTEEGNTENESADQTNDEEDLEDKTGPTGEEEESGPSEEDTADKTGSSDEGSGDSVNFSMKLDGGFDKRVLDAKTSVDIANVLRDFLTKISTEAKAAQ